MSRNTLQGSRINMLQPVRVWEEPGPPYQELARRDQVLELKADERPLPVLIPARSNGTAFSQVPAKPSLRERIQEHLLEFAD